MNVLEYHVCKFFAAFLIMNTYLLDDNYRLFEYNPIWFLVNKPMDNRSPPDYFLSTYLAYGAYLHRTGF